MLTVSVLGSHWDGKGTSEQQGSVLKPHITWSTFLLCPPPSCGPQTRPLFQFQFLVYKISGVSMAQTTRFLVEHHELVRKIHQRTPTPLDISEGSLRQEIGY